MKPAFNPPGTQHLTLTFNKMLSNVAFKINLRRYTKVRAEARRVMTPEVLAAAGAFTRPLFSST
jgi:hypothetical protein